MCWYLDFDTDYDLALIAIFFAIFCALYHSMEK